MRNLFDIIFKRKSQILLIFFAVVLAVSIGTFLVKPLYEASAQILIKGGRESIFVPTSKSANPVIKYKREEMIKSETEILKSRSLAEKVVLMMGPTVLFEELKDTEPGAIRGIKRLLKGLMTPDKKNEMTKQERQTLNFNLATSMLQENLEVESIEKSNVVRISLKHQNPTLVTLAVNNYVDIYLEQHVDIHRRPESQLFFRKQTDRLKTELEKAENELKNLKQKHHITSLEQERTNLLNQSSALRAELNKTLSQEVEIQKRILEIRRQLSAVPKTITQDEVIDHNQGLISMLEAKLVELEIEEKALLAKYTDQSRLVKNVKIEKAIVQEKLAAQKGENYGKKRTSVNSTYKDLQQDLYRSEAELKAIVARSQTQKEQLKEYMQNMAELNQIEVQINQLKQKIEVSQQNYQLYLAKFEEARISDAMDEHKITNVSIIEPASIPIKPISPNILLNLLVGIFLGALGSLGCAFTMEYLDDNIRRPEEVEVYLNLPVLASIPKLPIETK